MHVITTRTEIIIRKIRIIEIRIIEIHRTYEVRTEVTIQEHRDLQHVQSLDRPRVLCHDLQQEEDKIFISRYA
jgi:hypothetical protein